MTQSQSNATQNATKITMLQNKTIAIIGATGKTGQYVLPECLQKSYQIRMLVRDASKIEQITIVFRAMSTIVSP